MKGLGRCHFPENPSPWSRLEDGYSLSLRRVGARTFRFERFTILSWEDKHSRVNWNATDLKPLRNEENTRFISLPSRCDFSGGAILYFAMEKLKSSPSSSVVTDKIWADL